MPLVQLVERRFPKPNVVGSSPTGHDIKNLIHLFSFQQTKLLFFIQISVPKELFFCNLFIKKGLFADTSL